MQFGLHVKGGSPTSASAVCALAGPALLVSEGPSKLSHHNDLSLSGEVQPMAQLKMHTRCGACSLLASFTERQQPPPLLPLCVSIDIEGEDDQMKHLLQAVCGSLRSASQHWDAAPIDTPGAPPQTTGFVRNTTQNDRLWSLSSMSFQIGSSAPVVLLGDCRQQAAHSKKTCRHRQAGRHGISLFSPFWVLWVSKPMLIPSVLCPAVPGAGRKGPSHRNNGDLKSEVIPFVF
jgi:hypothetical protein